MSLISAPPASLNNVVPFIRPPVSGLNWGAAARGGGIAFGVGLLGAYILDKAQEAGDKFTEENLARAGIRNPNTGMAGGKPPFIGGQSGVAYRMVFEATIIVFENQPWRIGEIVTQYARGRGGQITGFQGPIASIGTPYASGAQWYASCVDAQGANGIVTDFATSASQTNNARYSQPRFVRLERADNQTDTGGNPPSTLPDTFSGYTGTNGETIEDRQKKPIGAGPLGGVGFGSSGFASGAATIGVGIGGASPKSADINKSETSSSDKSKESNDFKNKIPDRFPSGLGGPLLKPFEPPVIPKPPAPLEKPPLPKKKEEEKKIAPPPPLVPPPPAPPSPEVLKLQQDLALIIGALGAMKIPVDNINTNTQPEAQRLNAKNGSCDALNSPSCVQNLKDDIKNPINQNINEKSGNILQNVGAIASVVDATSNKLDGVKSFLEKVARSAKLDKIYNLLTFITVIHNAQMLSNSLATTLMDSLSLGLATIGIKDENESPIDIQSIINKSVEDTVKGIIGAANYTTLSDRWKAAVRVYQAAANITYQVRSLWDSAKSLAELTGANVGKIGNALRRDGVVSENAYTAMADNPLMVNSAMSKLQNLEEAASHINAITSEAYGVTETVTQIKKDQDDFKKLAKEGLSSTPIVNDQQKAKDDAAKIASVSPSISTTDLSKP